MWLLSYKHGLNSSGRPTSVWGDDLRDAMPFRYVEQARALAAAINGLYRGIQERKGGGVT